MRSTHDAESQVPAVIRCLPVEQFQRSEELVGNCRRLLTNYYSDPDVPLSYAIAHEATHVYFEQAAGQEVTGMFFARLPEMIASSLPPFCYMGLTVVQRSCPTQGGSRRLWSRFLRDVRSFAGVGAMGTQITIKRLTGVIGAEVRGVNLNQPLDERTFATIRQAFLDHSMLLFRRQFLEPTAHTVFTHRWGEVLRAPYVKQGEMPDHPEVLEVVNRGKSYAFTTEQWHSDLSFMPTPPAHAILAAQVLPETGGDTMFANQYVAYETLSEGMKRLLSELRAWHGGAKLAALAGIEDSAPHQSHPIVRTHPETGRKGLFVNRLYTYCIEGLTEDESRGLLRFLFEQICRPEFTYRHQWAPGDVIMWDNRCTLHYAVHDYGDAQRVMHRTTIAGDVPR